jgi:triacylglycerol esterase/lipase EstA (alpha/beta hydrolase family)
LILHDADYMITSLGSRNRTAEFNSIVNALLAGDVLWQWPAIASPFNFVFVGGLWSSYYPLAYVMSLRGLINQGIAATRLTGIDTRASVEINGAILVEELKNAIVQHPTKKLIIMAHSKGSLDILEAMRLEPSLAPHVHRLVAIQSPFGGSPYAVRIPCN